MTRLAKPARPGRPGGPYPTAQAALLRRLDSHARAFFGEEEGDEEEVEEEKEEAVPASRPPHVGPAGGATEPSSSGDDSGDESNSCSSSDEEEGAGRARRGGARAPPVPQPRRPALVVVAGPGGRAAAPTTTAPHAPPPPLDLRAERKALMSGAADVTSGGPVPGWRKQADGRKKKKQRKPAAVAEAPTTAPGPSAVPTKAEFAAMRREVEEFGKWTREREAAFSLLSPVFSFNPRPVASIHLTAATSLSSPFRRRQPGQARPRRRGDPPPHLLRLPGP